VSGEGELVEAEIMDGAWERWEMVVELSRGKSTEDGRGDRKGTRRGLRVELAGAGED
jgi:hypothetical protein